MRAVCPNLRANNGQLQRDLVAGVVAANFL